MTKNKQYGDYHTNVSNHFEDLFAQHGDDYRALGWGSNKGQITRFQVLSEIGITSGSSVLDIGCGLGNLYEWFQDNNISVDYHGIDITRSLVEKSKAKFPNGQFDCVSFLDFEATISYYDYVIASGIFYLQSQDPYNFMQEHVAKMFSIANKGVVFNTLSKWSGDNQDNEFFADPLKVLDFCKNLTTSLIFRHDYHSGDFSIYLYK